MFTDVIFTLRLDAQREQLRLRVIPLDDWAADASILGPQWPPLSSIIPGFRPDIDSVQADTERWYGSRPR